MLAGGCRRCWCTLNRRRDTGDCKPPMFRSNNKRSLFGIFLVILLAFTIVYVVGYSLYLGTKFTDILHELQQAAGFRYRSNNSGDANALSGGAAYHDHRFAFNSYSQNTSELLVTYNDSTWFRYAFPFENVAAAQKHPLLQIIQNALGFGKAEKSPPPITFPVASLDHIGFPINKPNVCATNKTTGRLHLLVIVVSAPDHLKQRNAIRGTWGSILKMKENRCALLFFLGYQFPQTASPGGFLSNFLEDNNNNNKAVESEDQKHGDIVQANFTEAYRNLTLKSVLLLRWVTENCGQARFVLKTDDDMFINVINLLKFTANARHSEYSLIGRLAHNWKPVRNPKSKWYVSRKDFPFRSYPPFVTGPAYIFGAKIAPALLNACLQMPFFFLEDVFVTGLCATKAKIPRYNHVDFINYRVPLNVCRYQNIISSHDISVKELKLLWPRVISEDKTKCKRKVLPGRRFGRRF